MRSKDHQSQLAYGLLCGVYGHLATNEIAKQEVNSPPRSLIATK